MIVAVPSSSDKIDALIDERFGRCPFFCFYNTKKHEVIFKKNDLKNGAGGVGPQVVEFLVKNGVDEVYATEVGPKAKTILDKLNIKTTIINTRQTIQQVINRFNN